MDFQQICRICLESNKQIFDIYTSYCEKKNTLYSEMISYCTNLKPEKDDGLPKHICKHCVRHLKQSYIFHFQCYESDKKLRAYLNCQQKPQFGDCRDEIKQESDMKCEIDPVDKVDQGVLELLNQNIVSQLKEDIKFEPNHSQDLTDKCWNENSLLREVTFPDLNEGPTYNEGEIDTSWDSDDNILLNKIKTTKEQIDNGTEPRKKKRGRKKAENGAVPVSKMPHQCDVCGKVLSTKSNLKTHQICHTDLRPYQCADCPAAFRGHSALFQHKKVHSGETPYHCEYCPKRFARRTGLVNHIRMHTGEKLFTCDICLKSFVQSAQLTIHLRRHKGDKSFLCQDCGKGFPVKAELKTHQRIHSGEKPYSCHMCTKTFATSGNLSIHIRIHKQEIRYKCKECHRGFVTKSAFNVHVKRHKGQRDYLCECGKTFFTSSALKQHRVVHTGEKKYQCKICDRKYSQTSHLSRHLKRDHSKTILKATPIGSNGVQSESQFKLVLQENKSLYHVSGMAKLEGVKCEGT